MYSLMLLVLMNNGVWYEGTLGKNLTLDRCAYLKNGTTVEMNDKMFQENTSEIQIYCIKQEKRIGERSSGVE